MPRYQGPLDLTKDVDTALAFLTKHVTYSITTAKSHSVLLIGDIFDNKSILAISVYLVASIAQVIEINLGLRKALFDLATYSSDLCRDVNEVIGCDNTMEPLDKAKTRDAWIWEGISHLIFHLARTIPALHPHGTVQAKSMLHLNVRETGVDTFAIYTGKNIGVSIGESKAYADDPNAAIRKASKIFAEIDESQRDSEIRRNILSLRSSLPSDVDLAITESFWRRDRAYFPFICCDAEHALNWIEEHAHLLPLVPCAEKKILVPFAIKSMRPWFDTLSDYMREYSRGTLLHV